MLNERDWRRRNRDRDEEKKKKKEFWWENANDSRTKEESTFYTNTTKDGTIKHEKPEKPEKPDIPTIKENIETAKTNVDNLTKAHWDTIINGGTDDQIYTAKKNVENAQNEVENFNLQLTEAYGLGPNGYWNNKNPMNKQDRIVHEAGQKTAGAAQSTTTTTVAPKPITRPKTVTELDNWVNNPQGYRPQTAASATNPKVTTPVTPRKRVTRVPTTHLDMDIAQMQDELVNNPNMSEQKKWGIEDKITKLSADRDVLRWKKTLDHSPAIEEYQAQQRQASTQHQYAQDEYVNAIGSGKVKAGTEESYAMQAKIDKLEEKAKAYNRGMMGVLDGEKAVHRNEQETSSTTRSGGGQMGDMSLSANNDEPMYVGMNDDKQQSVFLFDNAKSEEERLRQEIEVTFASLQNMSDKEQTEFMMSDEGKKYQQNLNELRNLIGFLKYTDYTKELYGEGIDNTQSYSSVEYLDSIKDDRGHVNPNNIVNTVKDKVDYLKEQISGFYIEAKNMSSVELEEKHPNGIGDITAMEFELQDLIGNKEYQEFMSLLLPEQENLNITPNDFFGNLDNLESQLERYQTVVNDLNGALKYATTQEDRDRFNTLIKDNEQTIALINQQITDLKGEYIEQNFEKDYPLFYGNVDVEITGSEDLEVLNVIRETGTFGEMVKLLNTGVRQGGESKFELHLDEKVRVVLSNEDAYKVYHDACEKVENERDLAITIMLAGLGAITMGASVPVSYAVIAASGAISYGIETSPEDIDYIDLLGGEYTVNTFKMETDLDGLSRNNRKIVYEGLIIHGDPIILDNGEIIDNPLNTIVFKCTEFH